MRECEGEWAVAYKDQGLGHGMYGVVVKASNEVLFEDISREDAEAVVRRWNSYDALLKVCTELADIFPEQSMSEMDAADFKDRANRIWTAAQSAKAAITKTNEKGE